MKNIKHRPTIVICNDDGIYAPGIRSLWKSLYQADFADLFIIAPLSERSGTGVSITWDRPMLVQSVEWDEKTPAWAVDGTPADCIKMASKMILDRAPDFIVSGVNAGSNAGRNVLHSGTIGAVIEGVLRGIPGIAFSCEDGENPNFNIAELYIPAFVQYVLENPLQSGSFLNVNFPRGIKDKVKGFRLTRQGKGRWSEDPFLHIETEHGPSYWLGGKPEELTEDEDCDIILLKQGYATAVPVFVHELTDKVELKKRQESFESFFAI